MCMHVSMCAYIYVSMICVGVVYCTSVCRCMYRWSLGALCCHAPPCALESLNEPGAILYPVSPSDPAISAQHSICVPDV